MEQKRWWDKVQKQYPVSESDTWLGLQGDAKTKEKEALDASVTV